MHLLSLIVNYISTVKGREKKKEKKKKASVNESSPELQDNEPEDVLEDDVHSSIDGGIQLT